MGCQAGLDIVPGGVGRLTNECGRRSTATRAGPRRSRMPSPLVCEVKRHPARLDVGNSRSIYFKVQSVDSPAASVDHVSVLASGEIAIPFGPQMSGSLRTLDRTVGIIR